MTGAAYWSGVVGVVLGGSLTLTGTWLQGRQAAKAQERADSRALKMAEWKRNRKLREQTYLGMTQMLLDWNSAIGLAAKVANEGGHPEPMDVGGKKMDSTWIEAHIYASDVVKSLWLRWRTQMEELAQTIGGLVHAQSVQGAGGAGLEGLRNQLAERERACSDLAQAVIHAMHAEMSMTTK